MPQISPSDQTLISNKLAAVRRELATLTNFIATVENAVRTNNEALLTRQLQTNPLSSVTTTVQDSFGAIATVYRITNKRANFSGLAGAGFAGTQQLS